MTILSPIISISIGAISGALLRWFLGIVMNPIFPTLPLGTLASNLLGGFIIGIVLGLTKNQAFFPEVIRLGIVTGFLGSLTTFSTFSAEVVTLLSSQQFFWAAITILGHVVGSLIATFLGIYGVRVLIF